MVESHSAIPSCDTYALLVLSKLSQASITGQTHAEHEPIVKCSADTKMTQAGSDQKAKVNSITPDFED